MSKVAVVTLTEFLLARIAEDEQLGQTELAFRGSGTTYPLGHPLDPARVLAECAAKRAIVEDYESLDADYCVTRSAETEARRFQALIAVARVASVYADHDDYRDDWKP